MKKKLLSVLLTTAVLAGTLAGCGGSDAGGAAQSTETPAASDGGDRKSVV